MGDLVVPLHVRALSSADLRACSWAGTPTHLAHVAATLGRVAAGEVEYLAVCGPADVPLSIGSVDYAVQPGAGYLWQLVTNPALRSCGLGTRLVVELEAAAARRGCLRAELGVEDANVRARALYERLGYVPYRRDLSSWLVEGPDGSRQPYTTWCTMLTKDLPRPR